MAHILNEAGLNIIKHFEGCRLNCYLDSGGLATIGWGSTGPGIKLGLIWTQQQADDALNIRLNQLVKMLDGILAVNLTENQFSSLISFAYNEGIGNLERSTMFQYIQAGQFYPAAQEFTKWTRVNGVVTKGLVTRRQAEQTLFNSEV